MIDYDAQLLTTSLPLGLSATAAERSVLYSRRFVTPVPAELIVLGRFQVTNPYTYVVMVGSYLCRATDPLATTGATIARPLAKNVTPDEHHFPCERMDFDVCPPGDWYYNLVLYVASVNAKAGDAIRVDPYGKVAIKL